MRNSESLSNIKRSYFGNGRKKDGGREEDGSHPRVGGGGGRAHLRGAVVREAAKMDLWNIKYRQVAGRRRSRGATNHPNWRESLRRLRYSLTPSRFSPVYFQYLMPVLPRLPVIYSVMSFSAVISCFFRSIFFFVTTREQGRPSLVDIMTRPRPN